MSQKNSKCFLPESVQNYHGSYENVPLWLEGMWLIKPPAVLKFITAFRPKPHFPQLLLAREEPGRDTERGMFLCSEVLPDGPLGLRCTRNGVARLPLGLSGILRHFYTAFLLSFLPSLLHSGSDLLQGQPTLLASSDSLAIFFPTAVSHNTFLVHLIPSGKMAQTNTIIIIYISLQHDSVLYLWIQSLSLCRLQEWLGVTGKNTESGRPKVEPLYYLRDLRPRCSLSQAC